jgi:hypothetical protein
MTEPFRTREPEPTPDAPQAPTSVSTYKSDELAGYETKLQDIPTEEEKQIEIWEGLNRTKYINEYFNIKAYEGEFNLKMQTSQINKYIQGELDERKWDKTVDNWSKIMGEIEGEIGSKEMTTFDRISKITNYIRILNDIKKKNQLKEKYKTLFKTD